MQVFNTSKSWALVGHWGRGWQWMSDCCWEVVTGGLSTLVASQLLYQPHEALMLPYFRGGKKGSVVPQPNHITKGTQAQFKKQKIWWKIKLSHPLQYEQERSEGWRRGDFRLRFTDSLSQFPQGLQWPLCVLCPAGQGHPHPAAGTGSASFCTEPFQHTKTAEM